MFKHLTQDEIQQITFDWRYRGFTVLELLTEEECDEVNAEMERLRNERALTPTEDGGKWGDWDPFHILINYPHWWKKYFHILKLLKRVNI